jgi:CheY-like chemotaxis protein
MSSILVIDDEQQLRRVLRSILERAGHTVFEAQDGQKGMALWWQAPTEVVVTDIFMPEKDGMQILMELKHVATKPKIIAISGGDPRGLLDLKSAACFLGADRVLQKPFDARTFLATLEEVLKGGSEPSGVTSRSGMDEQRKYPRFPVALPASFGNGVRVLTGTVMDISREGCRICSADAVPSDKYFRLEIELEGSEERLTVNLTVMRWMRQREFGVEFIRMTSESQAQLRRIIRNCEEQP